MRRRWWQLLLRGAVMIALLLAAAYVTLPWWAPAKRVADALARRMSRQMGVPVSIGQMTLSWGEGVELRDLIVDSPPEYGAGPMIHVARIQTELSPIDFFVRKRIEWMEVFGLRLFARVDADGNVNVSRLKRLVFDAVAQRISVHKASAALELPAHKKLIRLNISDLQLCAGRINQIGRVTMSGNLDQQGRLAPVNLHLSEGSEQDPMAGTATFTFADIDLAQTPLASLLSRTVRKFAGRCGGSLELKLNRQGIVVPFGLNVSVRDLDVQPAHGPKLPVIKAAGLRVGATYDMITGRLDVASARFLLPGIDMAGSGTFFVDPHWPLVRDRNDPAEADARPRALATTLKLAGAVHPGRLASLLTGRAQLPGGLGVAGPVAVSVSLDRRGEQVQLDLSVQADDANIQHAGKTVKPPGRKLAVRVKGELNLRTWTFTTRGMEQTRLDLGSNWFDGAGRLRDLRGIARRWADPNARTVRQAVADLNNLSWRGEWEVSDLDALAALWPGRVGALSGVKLTGKIQGRCVVDPTGETVLSADAAIASDSGLSVPGLLETPAGQEMRLSVSGALVAGESPGLRDAQLTLIVGGRRTHVSGAQIRLTGGAGPTTVKIGGRFDVEKIQSLLACIPAARLGPVKITGDVRDAGIDADLGADRLRARAKLDLTALDIAVGDALNKPAGREMKADISLLRTGRSSRHSLTLTMPDGKIDVTLSFGGTAPAPDGQAVCKVDLTDAGWLARTSPALRKLLGPGRIAGPALLQAWARWTADAFTLDLAGDADATTYRSGDAAARAKAAGADLGLAASIRVRRDADKGLSAAGVSLSADVQFGLSRCTVDANTVTDVRLRALGHDFDPRRELRKLTGRIEASCVLDPPLLGLLPGLAELARKCDLAGTVDAEVSMDMRGETARARLRLDAARLAAGRVSVEPVGEFTKPAGMPAEIRADVSFAHDLSNVRIRELYARIADMHCTAAGTLRAPAPAATLQPLDFRVALSTQKVQTLHRILPAMKEYQLAGDGFVDVQWQRGPNGGRIGRAQLHARRLSGRLGGKAVSVAGEVAVERMSALGKDWPSIGRIVTDGLSLRIGDNDAWILADLTGIPGKPAGSVTVLAGYLDDKDLADWVSGLAAGRGGRPETPETHERKPAPDPKARADKMLDKAREALANANLAIRAGVDRLRNYDAKVEQYNDVNQLDLAAVVNRGMVRLRYAGGLSGGTIRTRGKVDLSAKEPVAEITATLDDVLASKSILPQLQRFFPGNTLYGSFSREEKTTVALRDLLAGIVDPRSPVFPVGTAKLVAKDGLVEGRAAPHFVTAIFPGLNLTKYPYDRMTSFTTLRPDGVAENDMIFNGPVYDMYMEGTTDTRQIARYEVGIILLSSPQSPQLNHDLRLGRIPILNVKGLIQKGKLVNDEVSYPWPTESLFTVFLKNNIFYRMWLSARKRK